MAPADTRSPSPVDSPTADDIRLKIADCESRGDWTGAGFWKSEMLRLSRTPTTSRSETLDPTKNATDVEDLRKRILVAESARDWNVAAELKTELLRIQRGSH